jgi:hypothetical protein
MSRTRKRVIVAAMVVLTVGLLVVRVGRKPATDLTLSFQGYATNPYGKVAIILVSNTGPHRAEITIASERNDAPGVVEVVQGGSEGDTLAPNQSKLYNVNVPPMKGWRVSVTRIDEAPKWVRIIAGVRRNLRWFFPR